MHTPSPSLCPLGFKQVTGPPHTPKEGLPHDRRPQERDGGGPPGTHSNRGGRHSFRSEISSRVCSTGGAEATGVMWEDGGIDRDPRSRPVGAPGSAAVGRTSLQEAGQQSEGQPYPTLGADEGRPAPREGAPGPHTGLRRATRRPRTRLPSPRGCGAGDSAVRDPFLFWKTEVLRHV